MGSRARVVRRRWQPQSMRPAPPARVAAVATALRSHSALARIPRFVAVIVALVCVVVTVPGTGVYAQPARAWALDAARIRPADGTGNNVAHPTYGAFRSGFARTPDPVAHYGDGVESLAGPNRPNPRNISRIIFPYHKSEFSSHSASSVIMAWGQFLVHELLWTKSNTSTATDPGAPAPIAVPRCDAELDPTCTGTATIPFTRVKRGDGVAGAPPTRPITNWQTAWFDGSGLYGWSQARSDAQRTFQGGRVRMQPAPHPDVEAGDLLPFNSDNHEVLAFPGVNITAQFFSGDVRAGENALMATLHTLFRREHNARAALYARLNSTLTDEQLFQLARNWVTALLCQITYREYLPPLLGAQVTPEYNDTRADTGDSDYGGGGGGSSNDPNYGRIGGRYNSSLDPGIDVLFWTAAFRYGHSDSNEVFLRLDESRNPIPAGHLYFLDSALNPQPLVDDGIECVLRGLVVQPLQEVDGVVQDDVRASAVDLCAVNIQRGREVGAPSYSQARAAFQLPPVASFAEARTRGTFLPGAVDRLVAAYGDDGIDDVDAWVGGLLEHPNGGILGPLFQASLRDQFLRLRDGDRFWYQRDGQLLPGELNELQTAAGTFAGVVLRNTNITTFPDKPFRVQRLAVAAPATASAANGKVRFFDDYEFAWNMNGDTRMMEGTMTATGLGPGVGFVGIGFGATSMSDVDIVLCWLAPGTGAARCQDSYSEFFHPYPDTDFGSTDDLDPTSVSATVEPDGSDDGTSRVTFRWRRPFRTPDTGRDYQFDEADGQVAIIYAHGHRSGLVYHELPNRGFGRINFFTGAVAGFGADVDYKSRVSHGLSMAFTWLLLYPAGVWVARYQKHQDWWLYVHQKLQEFGVLNVFVFALMGILTTPQHFLTPHSHIAMVLLSLLAIQLVLGHATKYRLKHDTRRLVRGRRHQRSLRSLTRRSANTSTHSDPNQKLQHQSGTNGTTTTSSSADPQHADGALPPGCCGQCGGCEDGCCACVGDCAATCWDRALSSLVRLSWLHAPLGYAMLLLAPVQAWYGLDFLYPTDTRYKTALYGLAGGLVTAFAVWEIEKQCTEYRARKRAASQVYDEHTYRYRSLGAAAASTGGTGTGGGPNDGAGAAAGSRVGDTGDDDEPEYDWHQIALRVQSGASWVVVRGGIYDVKLWMESHPGGQAVLQDAIGTDCTAEFFGDTDGGDDGAARHRHTSLAIRKLSTLRVGRLPRDPTLLGANGGGASPVPATAAPDAPMTGAVGGKRLAGAGASTVAQAQQISQYRHFRLTERQLLTTSAASLPVLRLRFALQHQQQPPQQQQRGARSAGAGPFGPVTSIHIGTPAAPMTPAVAPTTPGAVELTSKRTPHHVQQASSQGEHDSKHALQQTPAAAAAAGTQLSPLIRKNSGHLTPSAAANKTFALDNKSAMLSPPSPAFGAATGGPGAGNEPNALVTPRGGSPRGGSSAAAFDFAKSAAAAGGGGAASAGAHRATDDGGFVVVAGQHVVAQTVIGDTDRRLIVERSYTPWPDWGAQTAAAAAAGAGAGAAAAAATTSATTGFDLVVKVYPKGPMTSYLSSLRVGDRVKFRGPVGASLLNGAHPRGVWSHLTLIAAGTGITPMAQLVHFHLAYNRWLAAQQHRAAAAGAGAGEPLHPALKQLTPAAVELIAFNRTSDDIIAADAWAAQARASDGQFAVAHVLTQRPPPAGWSGPTGRPTLPLLQQLIRAVPTPAALLARLRQRQQTHGATVVSDSPSTGADGSVVVPATTVGPSSGSTGRDTEELTPATVQRQLGLAPQHTTSRIVVCGPRGFVRSVTAILEALGYADDIVAALGE